MIAKMHSNVKLWKQSRAFYVKKLVIARAAEQGSQEASALQSYIEGQGLFYGEYGDCMYTYTNQEKEVKIIGLNKDAEEIKLPGKIDGKKVTSIDLVPRYMFGPGKNYAVKIYQ